MVLKLKRGVIFTVLLLIVIPIQMLITNSYAVESTVTIQPSIEDTFVNNMYLKHKYPEEPHGYLWAIFAGNMYTEYDSFKGYGSSRIYIKFNTTSIPSDAKIINAKLCLYMYDSPKTDQEFEAYRVLSEWNEHNLTWINQPDFAERSSSSTTIQSGQMGKWICWEITEDVRMWHVGKANNYGTMVKIKNEVNASDQVASFYPSETKQEKQLTPKLIIKIDWHEEIQSNTTLATTSNTKEQQPSTTEKQPTPSPSDSPSVDITNTDIKNDNKNNQNQTIDYLLPIAIIFGISILVILIIFKQKKVALKNKVSRKRILKPRSK